jgi:cytochrome c
MSQQWIAAALLGAFALTAGSAHAATTEEAMTKAGCMACHAKDKKVLGPAFTEKVRKGGSGVWGPIPMSPNPADKISDADLKAAIELVLKS